jgi:UDP-N-acetylglucosamine 2-epimerase (non-hydrolysing)
MIDTLVRLLPIARQSCIRQRFGLDNDRPPGSPLSTRSLVPAAQSPAAIPYGVATLHRPSNVDDQASLKQLMLVLSEIAKAVPLVFPVHPRTRQRLAELELPSPPPGLHLTEPLGYVDFLALEESATFVITDSGGIQEETTYLGVPCVTVRENTERPVTITEGTNILVGREPDQLYARIREILAGQHKTGGVPELWDGKAAARIARVIRENCQKD